MSIALLGNMFWSFLCLSFYLFILNFRCHDGKIQKILPSKRNKIDFSLYPFLFPFFLGSYNKRGAGSTKTDVLTMSFVSNNDMKNRRHLPPHRPSKRGEEGGEGEVEKWKKNRKREIVSARDGRFMTHKSWASTE